jgi:hypothetical protein
VRGDPTLSTRHWVDVVQAQALAGIGNAEACRRALDAAEGVRMLGSAAHNGGWLRFDGSRLAEERGSCHIELGNPGLAEPVLTEALRGDLSDRRRGSVFVDLATAGIHSHDPDMVLTNGFAALAIARRTQSGVVGRRLRHLQSQLPPLSADRGVQELDHEITSTLVQMSRGNAGASYAG